MKSAADAPTSLHTPTRDRLARLLVVLLFVGLVGGEIWRWTGFPLGIVAYLLVVAQYAFVSAYLWLSKNNTHLYHWDKGTLILFVLTSAFRRRLGVPGEDLCLTAIGLSGLAAAIFLAVHWNKLPRASLRWTAIAVLASVMALVPISIVEVLESAPGAVSIYSSPHVVLSLLRQLVYSLSFTSPIEEMVFRGLLWGSLLSAGWSDRRAAIAQGALFWLGHWDPAGHVLRFLISVPILTVTTTYLTRRSKQLFPACITHVAINTLAPLR